MSTTLNEKAVEKEKSLKGEAVVPDTVRDPSQDHRLDILQRPRLQRSVEAPPLKEVEFAIVEDAIIVEIADFEDARQRRLGFRRQHLRLRVEQRTRRMKHRLCEEGV